MQLAESSIYESLKLKASVFRSPSIYGCRNTTLLCTWDGVKDHGDKLSNGSTIGSDGYEWAIFAVEGDPVIDIIDESKHSFIVKDGSLLYCSTHKHNDMPRCFLNSADEAQNVSTVHLDPLGNVHYNK